MITVLGPRAAPGQQGAAGQVATFQVDAPHTDGRHPAGRQAIDLLADTGLAAEVLGEVMGSGIVSSDMAGSGSTVGEHWRASAAIVAAIDEPDLPLTLAVLAERSGGGADAIQRIAARLRLSNREAKGAATGRARSAAARDGQRSDGGGRCRGAGDRRGARAT